MMQPQSSREADYAWIEVPRNVMHDANCPGRIPTGAETVCNCLTEGSIGAMLFLGSECYAELTYQNIK